MLRDYKVAMSRRVQFRVPPAPLPTTYSTLRGGSGASSKELLFLVLGSEFNHSRPLFAVIFLPGSLMLSPVLRCTQPDATF